MFFERVRASHLNLKPGDYCEVVNEDDGSFDFGSISEIAYPLVIFKDGRKYPWNSIFYRHLSESELKEKYKDKAQEVFSAINNKIEDCENNGTYDHDNSWLLSCDNIYELTAMCQRLHFTITSWYQNDNIHFWFDHENNVVICFYDIMKEAYWTLCPIDKYTQLCNLT